MLKKFFLAFLGSLAAIWVSIALVAVGCFITLSVLLAYGFGRTVEVEDGSILYIDLHGEIAEYPSGPSVQDMLFGEGYDESVPNMRDMIRAINAAKDDSRIEGIYLDCGDSQLGYASRQELAEALKNFKTSGKWIYAYADNYSQADYLVASTANSLYLNPSGNVDIKGLGVGTLFFKNALDKLGIDIQVMKVGTFKSAVEPYLLTEMSDSARMQTQVFIDNIWASMKDHIASQRKVTVNTVTAWADTLTCTIPTDYLVDNKIIDQTAYRRVFEDKLRKLTNVEPGEDLRLVTPMDYLLDEDIKEEAIDITDTDHIALLYAVGEITDYTGNGIVGADMVPQIIELAENEHVKGLVMRVNSGGGSAFASEQIWEALEYFKSKGKPFYVSMGDYAASGGYYISCGADKIYADNATLTGSIGIFGIIPDIQKLLNNHLGVNMSFVSTNTNATFPNIYTAMTPAQRNAMQNHVEQGYKLFTGRVAKGRNLNIAHVLRIAEGRVWDGQMAKRLGLVDEIGSLNSALLAMSKKTGLDMTRIVDYPDYTRNLLDEILSVTNLKVTAPIPAELQALQGLTPEEVRFLALQLQRLRTQNPMQMRMENIILK